MRNKLLFFSLLVFISACTSSQKEVHPASLDFSKFPLKNLSEYGFFKGKMSDILPNTNVLLYEPAATLFTDYAFKKRFVWMPDGVSATADISKPNESLNFPDKTILIKNFYYPADFNKPDAQKRIIETRLLVKDKGEWQPYSYRWNDDQNDAVYKPIGDAIPLSWKDEKGVNHNIIYAMPNKNQCRSCHNYKGKFTPIGPKLKQLNWAFNNSEGKENQLDKWQKAGFLTGTIEKEKIVPVANIKDETASLDLRARSYLEVNCGHCHSEGGPAETSGLRLNIEEKDPYHWGIGKSPVAAGMGAGDLKYDILAGKGDESIIVYRMNSTHPGVMMPEIGRVTIHTEGVDLIRKWIDEMKTSAQ